MSSTIKINSKTSNPYQLNPVLVLDAHNCTSWHRDSSHKLADMHSKVETLSDNKKYYFAQNLCYI